MTNFYVFLLIVGVISLFIGSFLNVVIYRLPRMIETGWANECRLYLGLKSQENPEAYNLCLPGSQCPRCKTPIKPWHNVPVFSYLWLQGKCAHCHAPISIRYPIIESFTCFISVFIAWHYGVSLQTLAALMFTWISICLTVIDIDHHLLPDELTLLLVWTGLFFSLFEVFCNSHEAILGGIAGYLIFALTQRIFKLVTKKDGMGQGDLKFLAGLGAYFGWQFLPMIILFASITGIVLTVLQMTIKRNFESVPLPFGPYLAIAGWVVLVWGNEIMRHYLGYF